MGVIRSVMLYSVESRAFNEKIEDTLKSRDRRLLRKYNWSDLAG